MTYARRLEMVKDTTERGDTTGAAAASHGVSAVTARNWLGRFLAAGPDGLLDRSSRPEKSPRAIEPQVALTIVELRRKLCLQAQIASCLGVSKATVSRVLKRACLSKLSDLRPAEPVERYEREQPGELLHIDIKKLGRFDRICHRITGDRTPRARHIGWESDLVAVYDHGRVAFTKIYPDESKHSAVVFLRSAVTYFERFDVPIQRVLTDNGKLFHSALFASTCLELDISQKFTRAYRPQTNGKAERFIQSALREWAYGQPYASSDHRRDQLPAWNHFYNWHRPHHGINLKPPVPRLSVPRKNLLTLHRCSQAGKPAPFYGRMQLMHSSKRRQSLTRRPPKEAAAFVGECLRFRGHGPERPQPQQIRCCKAAVGGQLLVAGRKSLAGHFGRLRCLAESASRDKPRRSIASRLLQLAVGRLRRTQRASFVAVEPGGPHRSQTSSRLRGRRPLRSRQRPQDFAKERQCPPLPSIS